MQSWNEHITANLECGVPLDAEIIQRDTSKKQLPNFPNPNQQNIVIYYLVTPGNWRNSFFGMPNTHVHE